MKNFKDRTQLCLVSDYATRSLKEHMCSVFVPTPWKNTTCALYSPALGNSRTSKKKWLEVSPVFLSFSSVTPVFVGFVESNLLLDMLPYSMIKHISLITDSTIEHWGQGQPVCKCLLFSRIQASSRLVTILFDG